MSLKYAYKSFEDVTSNDKKNYVAFINKDPANYVPLVHAKEVAKGISQKSDAIVYTSVDPTQNRPSARISKTKSTTLQRGIQLYRMWFNFLKLALELEALGVALVIRQPTFIKNIDGIKTEIPESVLMKSMHSKGGRAGDSSGHKQIFRCRLLREVKVDRSAYSGWDIEGILDLSFDAWWATHSHLFEGFYPSILNTKDQWVDFQNFLYVRFDRSSKWTDVKQFIKDELRTYFTNKSISTKYEILGKNPRVNVLQNNFNALVLSLKGWSPKKICLHENIYLRKTDEHFASDRTKGERLTVTKDRTGKPKYSVTVSKQRTMGIHHLFEVCEGRFGKAPSSSSHV